MTSLELLLTNFSETHRVLAYLILFFITILEGEIVLLLAGILSYKGYLNISNVITIAFAAAILHDLFYWSIGRRFSKTNRKKIFFIDLEKIRGALEKLKDRNGLYIFISKFAWSLNRLILITSGFTKIPVKEFLRYSVPACFVWTVTLVSIGYVFASETNVLRQDIKTALVLFAIFLTAVILFENLIRRTIKRIMENRR